ncbi:hypothetical protein BDB01DRAFT_852723 [Pilobolus umbonatus]|nr:hypothetical protein BDB01DRAFT_852723 [Pilobolus umbonatus]
MDLIKLKQMEEECEIEISKNLVVLRVCVSDTMAGVLIGKSGSHFRLMQQRMPVKLCIKGDKQAPDGRVLFMTGAPEFLASCWAEFYNRIMVKEMMVHIDFILPHDFSLYVQESTDVNYLEDIARSTGVKLIMKKGFLPRSTDRLLRMIPSRSTSESVKQAVLKLAGLFQEYKGIALSGNNLYYQAEPNDLSDAFIKTKLELYQNIELKDIVYLFDH